MKTCVRCGKSLALSEFYKNKRNSDGHFPRCKTCHVAYTNEKRLEKYGSPFWFNMWRSYKLTQQRYEEMLAEQDGLCAICKTKEPTMVDHDHSCCASHAKTCGQCIRGLLCRYCNTSLRLIEDHLDAALTYLSAKKV